VQAERLALVGKASRSTVGLHRNRRNIDRVRLPGASALGVQQLVAQDSRARYRPARPLELSPFAVRRSLPRTERPSDTLPPASHAARRERGAADCTPGPQGVKYSAF